MLEIETNNRLEHSVPASEPPLHEPPHRLLAEHVPCPSAHVALPDVRPEVETEVDRVRGVPGGHEGSEVVDHDVGVVVRLQEPVKVVDVTLVDVCERLLRLAPQAVSA